EGAVGEAVGPGQPPHLPVQGPDLGQQPRHGPEQHAQGDPDDQHHRRRDGAVGQDRAARQRAKRSAKPGPPKTNRYCPTPGPPPPPPRTPPPPPPRPPPPPELPGPPRPAARR